MIKRLVDIAVSAVGLIALSPLLLGVAVWIKLDSSGPVFFRQTRLGRSGRRFRIHKFRSMAERASGGFGELTVVGDSRITRAGAILRRTKLDELPQLLDVLSGEMSLVGPRPEVPRYVAYYDEAAREEILSVRPGITDLSAIEFRNENELLAGVPDPELFYVREILPRKVELYRQYVRKHSIFGDLVIIAKTIAAIFGRG